MSNKPVIDQSSLSDEKVRFELDAHKLSTTQRAIAELMKAVPRGIHPTATEIYRQAQKAGINTSLSTVYRILNNLQIKGDVTTLGGEHGKRYETFEPGEEHDHLVCIKCGLTIEFVDELIKGLGKTVAKRKGYEHKSSRFDILGLCQQCKLQNQNHRIDTITANLKEVIGVIEQIAVSSKKSINLLESGKTTKVFQQLAANIELLQNALKTYENILDL